MISLSASYPPLSDWTQHGIRAVFRLLVGTVALFLPDSPHHYVDRSLAAVFALSYLIPAFLAWRRGGLPARPALIATYLAATFIADCAHVALMRRHAAAHLLDLARHHRALAVRELSVLRHYISPGVRAEPDPRARGGRLFRALLFVTRALFAPAIELSDPEHFDWPRLHRVAAATGHWVLLAQALVYVTVYPPLAFAVSTAAGLADRCLRAQNQAGIVAGIAVVFAGALFWLDEEFAAR